MPRAAMQAKLHELAGYDIDEIRCSWRPIRPLRSYGISPAIIVPEPICACREQAICPISTASSGHFNLPAIAYIYRLYLLMRIGEIYAELDTFTPDAELC